MNHFLVIHASTMIYKMKKYIRSFRLLTTQLMLLVIFSAIQVAQAQDIKDQLIGNKWALTSYIQVEGMKYDTLFTALDCSGEFVRFNDGGQFDDSSRKKPLQFEVTADSIITFKKKSGLIHKRSRISYLDENRLTLVDVNSGKGIFLYRKLYPLYR